MLIKNGGYLNMNLEPLPYAYNALEPFIDEATMRVHHDKHHQTYFDKFQTAIAGTSLAGKDVVEILSNISKIPAEIRTAVVNHGGGHYHHRFFWSLLKKDVPFEGKVATLIIKKYGSYEQFKEEFTAKALSVFGSGWTWLVWNGKEIEIINTPNQDSLLSLGKKLLLGVDVWEHAYYLKYQNRRAEYVENFFKVINWRKVDEYFMKA